MYINLFKNSKKSITNIQNEKMKYLLSENCPLFLPGRSNVDMCCRLNSDGITAVYHALGSIAVRAENVHMFTQVLTSM